MTSAYSAGGKNCRLNWWVTRKPLPFSITLPDIALARQVFKLSCRRSGSSPSPHSIGERNFRQELTAKKKRSSEIDNHFQFTRYLLRLPRERRFAGDRS